MGSLFQLRDYWSQSFPGEEFSPSAVAVGDLDNLDTVDKVAIGSFQGVLRILLPGSARDDVRAADCLYERKFDAPILQLASGRFLPVSADVSRNMLAVLFPRRLALMNVERCGDAGGGSGNAEKVMEVYYKCEVHFETHFDHTVCNFAYGPFGRTNHDMICVQSMDGQLSIVDYNKVICQRFFPSNQFLIPGCLTYCWERDTFLTNNSSMFLMCYEFSNIANSIGSEFKERRCAGNDEADAIAASGGSAGAKIAPIWAFNLCDDAVAIETCRLIRGLPANDANIVVLCPYNLFVLSLNGECLFSKRLDVETCSLGIYPVPGVSADNLLVGAFNGSLYVYSDTALEWSAVMKAGCPLYLSVSNLCGTQGMILALSSESLLSVNYLGTDPAEVPLQPLESKAASYADMTHELKTVQRAIRRLLEEAEDDALSRNLNEATSQTTTPTTSPSAPMALPGQVAMLSSPVEPEARQRHTSPSPGPQPSTGPVATNRFALSLTFGETTAALNGDLVLALIIRFSVPFQHLQTLQDIVVQVGTVDPVAVEPVHTILPRISVGESLTVPLRVSAAPDKDQIVPSSLELNAVVAFTGKRHDTWAVRKTVSVPLSLVARPVPAVKNTAFSLQLNTNMSPPPSLVDLFSDLAVYGNVTANVLSIHYLNGADATVLVSKNAARFKVQGSTMEGLWLLTTELVRRIREHYRDEGDVVFSIPDELPLVDFAAVIDTHAAVRKELVDATSNANRAAQFLRNVQKRLLVRFRDRNPSNSDTMTILFEESYTLLQQATDGVVLAKARQRQACAMLNCCARLFFFWMQVKYPEGLRKVVTGRREKASVDVPRPAAAAASETTTTEDLLKELFACDISSDDGVGWEEITEAALVQLLDIKKRKVLNKNLEVSLNTANLKAYFARLVEHIKAGKGL